MLWREILVKSWYPGLPCVGGAPVISIWNAAARKEREANLIRNGMSGLVQVLQYRRLPHGVSDFFYRLRDPYGIGGA